MIDVDVDFDFDIDAKAVSMSKPFHVKPGNMDEYISVEEK